MSPSTVEETFQFEVSWERCPVLLGCICRHSFSAARSLRDESGEKKGKLYQLYIQLPLMVRIMQTYFQLRHLMPTHVILRIRFGRHGCLDLCNFQFVLVILVLPGNESNYQISFTKTKELMPIFGFLTPWPTGIRWSSSLGFWVAVTFSCSMHIPWFCCSRSLMASDLGSLAWSDDAKTWNKFVSIGRWKI